MIGLSELKAKRLPLTQRQFTISFAGSAIFPPLPVRTIPMSTALPVDTRAGFWRRGIAMAIDGIIVALPFQIIAAILFVATSGYVQQSGGVTYTSCATSQVVPEGLVPPPPTDSNFSRECHVYFFGAETARRLQVGRVTKVGLNTTSVWQGYMLDRNGHPVDGVSIDWIVMAAFIAYLFAMETRKGASLGDRWMRIRVIDAAAPGASGVPLRKIVVRYLATLIGFAPMFALLLVYFTWYESDLDAIAASGFFTWLKLAGVIAFAWFIIICYQVVRKRDPLYDRIAGTAVVRVRPDDAVGASP
jgi:uncharacterized RDD family membrane protein YckC